MMPSYSFNTQVLIVVSCVAIHNFFRKQQEQDWLFKQYELENLIVIDSDNENDEGFGIPSVTTQQQEEWIHFRLSIAREMEHDSIA